MKQPYIYTLPEAFIKDTEVPTRWRVWAVVNGFFVGGKKCWASNEWIGEQVKAHKDTVSQAVKELEALGYFLCERTARTRLISPGNPPMIGTDTYLRSVSTPISDRHERLSTSVSNSEKNTSASEDGRRAAILPTFGGEAYQEEKTVQAVSKISAKEKLAYLPLVRWAEAERGFPFLTTEVGKQLKALKLAKQNGLTALELKERWNEFTEDKFWSVKGFDWMNVVQDFNKRREV